MRCKFNSNLECRIVSKHPCLTCIVVKRAGQLALGVFC
jgi:hypothetical protein